MSPSPQIAFLDMRPSIAVGDAVRTRVGELERLCSRLEKCRVLVEAPHRHGEHSGTLYGLRIRLTFPDDELAIEIQPREEDIYDAIRNGFEAARRKLEDYERWRKQASRRSRRKSHPDHGL